MSCGCEPGCKSVTVSENLRVCQLHQNFIYDEETEFSASSDWEYHQAATDTVKKSGGWTLVFRVTPASGQSVHETWRNSGSHNDHPINRDVEPPGCATTNSSKSCDRHFRSAILDDWETYQIQQRKAHVMNSKGLLHTNKMTYEMDSVKQHTLVRNRLKVKMEVFKNGVSQQSIVFNGTGTDVESWMSSDRILSSTWSDMIADVDYIIMQFLGNRRSFRISKPSDHCNTDSGWLAVIETPQGRNCPWEQDATTTPYVYFSSGSSAVDSNDFDVADVLAVFVKY